ncbi:MAG TPA: ureidoglycolate lyase [Rhizomicrobium sp.]|nr:ureidoglycolate lyase [Rhizomicrobium sp.]
MSRVLRPEPLSAEAFAPFGEVIEARGPAAPINRGATRKFGDLARIDAGQSHATVHIYRSTPPAYPFALRVMENHPLGSQLFMPLSGRPWLVVVAPRGPFDPQAIRAFAAGPQQGVNLAPGTWHHFNLALGGVSDFLVADRAGPVDNLEEVALDGSILLEAP